MTSETLQLKKPSVKITLIIVLAALSIIMEALPPLFATPWSMRIDLVAVPWVICWILLGFTAAIICSAITLPIVAIIGPFAGGPVGAVMKFVASVWMFSIPALFVFLMRRERRSFIETKWLFAISAFFAIIVRDVVTILFNFYFAFPVFFNFSAVEVFSNSNYLSPISHLLGVIGLSAFIVEIGFWNSIQGVIDIFASWALGLAVLRRFYPKRSKDS